MELSGSRKREQGRQRLRAQLSVRKEISPPEALLTDGNEIVDEAFVLDDVDPKVTRRLSYKPLTRIEVPEGTTRDEVEHMRDNWSPGALMHHAKRYRWSRYSVILTESGLEPHDRGADDGIM